MRTFSLRAEQIKKDWFIVDAKNLILGRLSSIIASYLRGKHKPEFTPSMDCGDYVIVINADKVRVTGNKLEDHVFHWHTGYPGGIKQRTMKERLTSKFPERVIYKAVERMLPKGPLGRKMLKNLKVYGGENNPHAGQNPKFLDIASRNSKNVKRS
ncbi:MAG: 50S ribosomal protein L13 [Holosporaceae bacterium]|jgi:large subunit ribosomal protein L13|nr:50S ribosomal protein L13 [Holosporaceae bacterium]